jgi:elongation factor P
VSVEVPNVVELKIVETEPAVRGDTVTAVTKSAKMETGLVVQVPLFVAQDETIRVDTRDGRYIERVKK